MPAHLHRQRQRLRRVDCVHAIESVFAEPERFEPARSPNRHLAFGTGVHFCLGAPLARMEGRIVLGEMLRRLRAPRLDPDEAPEWSPGFVRGVKRFPLRFEAVGG